jgi:hypothetical protein
MTSTLASPNGGSSRYRTRLTATLKSYDYLSLMTSKTNMIANISTILLGAFSDYTRCNSWNLILGILEGTMSALSIATCVLIPYGTWAWLTCSQILALSWLSCVRVSEAYRRSGSPVQPLQTTPPKPGQQSLRNSGRATGTSAMSRASSYLHTKTSMKSSRRILQAGRLYASPSSIVASHEACRQCRNISRGIRQDEAWLCLVHRNHMCWIVPTVTFGVHFSHVSRFHHIA